MIKLDDDDDDANNNNTKNRPMIKNNLQQYNPYYFIPALNARIVGILHPLLHLIFKQQTLVRYSINATFLQ